MDSDFLRGIDEHVGRQLRAARIFRGYTQQALADEIGLSFQQLQKYERGVNRVSASRLYQLSVVLRVVPSYFFDGLIPAAANPFTPPVSENPHRE